MIQLQLNAPGAPEAVVDDNCGFQKFYKVAQTISDKLKCRFTQKSEDFDTLDWSFLYKGHRLSLHFNVYSGLAIVPAAERVKPNDSAAAREFAGLLKRKYYF